MASTCPLNQWDKNRHIDNLAKADYLLFCVTEGLIDVEEYLEKIAPINLALQEVRTKITK